MYDNENVYIWSEFECIVGVKKPLHIDKKKSSRLVVEFINFSYNS